MSFEAQTDSFPKIGLRRIWSCREAFALSSNPTAHRALCLFLVSSAECTRDMWLESSYSSVVGPGGHKNLVNNDRLPKCLIQRMWGVRDPEQLSLVFAVDSLCRKCYNLRLVACNVKSKNSGENRVTLTQVCWLLALCSRLCH